MRFPQRPPTPPRRAVAFTLSLIGVSAWLALGALLSCNNSSRQSVSTIITPITGRVVTTWGAPVSGAAVYLVPANQVPTTPITSADVLSGAAEAYDEPLEDLINSAAAASFPRATTDASGDFLISLVDTAQSFFPYVDVAGAQPADLYPGGNLSRVALTGNALLSLDIEVTGHPTASASYVGSSTCLGCHPSYTSQKIHAHRFGFRQPGVDGPLQDISRFSDFDDGLAFFTDATAANFKSNGTSLWYYNYDGSRGFDKFEIDQTDPGGAEIRVYLWRDTATGEHKVTMENLVNGEPDQTYVVELTYGGAYYKQRYLLQVPDPNYAGRYPFLQYQQAGDDSYYDRTRHVWRDYHMDFFWDAGTQTFQFPAKDKNIESNCMACHTTGYRYFDDPMTGERMADGVDDPAGVFDIDNDGNPDEINTGCEVCHGPGSEHAAVARAQFIVNPNALSPSREAQICGRCHDRVLGNDDRMNEQPLNAAGEMAPPGTSRADYLADYTSRKGPALSSFWDDETHSKSHHQQYADFIKSAHYRNDRRLVACSNCHDLHGKGAYDGELRGNPKDGALCSQCHIVDVEQHVLAKTGSPKYGPLTECTQCHFYDTAKTGAGRYGRVIATPTGNPSDENIVYWENDISSHLTALPFKTNSGVAGQIPGQAMPVPYTNVCAVCHDVSGL